MIGLDQQVRQSDAQSNTQDLMFAEYGSDQTVVLSAGGTLTQSVIEDASVRSAMNMGAADRLILDPISLVSLQQDRARKRAHHACRFSSGSYWRAPSHAVDLQRSCITRSFTLPQW
jgi:hypothetical protein